MSEIFKPEISEEINRTRAILKKAEVFGAEETAKAFGIHPSSVWRLRKKVAEGGPACDRRRFNPGAASSVDGRRVEWALAFMAARQGAPLSVVCRELNKAAIREGWPETHYGALRRAIEKLPADMRTLLAKGGKAAFEKAGLVGKNEQSRPLELVQMDASEMPIWTIHPATGLLVKPWMTGVIDSFSRVVTGIEFHLEEPNAVDAAKALSTAFLPKDDESNPFFGVPETVQTDNAQAYIGKMMNGLAYRAGFILDNTPVGCPAANGKIERFFQTFQDGLLSRLSGYASQSNAKAKAENWGVVPWEVLKSVSRRFLLEYHSSVHSGIGTTPWEAWHENISNAQGYFVPVAEIRRRMRIEVECDVTREGVTILGSNYSGKALNGLVGSKVVVLTSPFGGDQSVEVFHNYRLIGRLIPRAAATTAINTARLDRKIELAGFRKDMRESLDDCPPVDAPEIVSPKAERKRIRAAQNKPARRGKIHPVKLEIESDERRP